MDKAEFLKQLGEKLKAAGLPILEQDLEILYKILSAHLKEFKFENDLVRALLPVALEAIDKVVLSLVDKIDGQPG